MNRKSLKELKLLIEADLKYCESFINSMQEDKNPQVKDMVVQKELRIEALEDVLLYINNGNKFQFDRQ